MKIEAGKFYMSRDGQRVEVLAVRPERPAPVIAILDGTLLSYFEDGRYRANAAEVSTYDLMEEAVTYGPWQLSTKGSILSGGYDMVELAGGTVAYRKPVTPKVAQLWGMVGPGYHVAPSIRAEGGGYNYRLTLPLTGEGYPDFNQQPTWGAP